MMGAVGSGLPAYSNGTWNYLQSNVLASSSAQSVQETLLSREENSPVPCLLHF